MNEEITASIKELINQHGLTYDGLLHSVKHPSVKALFEPQLFDVQTPVTRSGYILFNNSRQILRTDHRTGLYFVSVAFESYEDLRTNFAWQKTTREELKPGDVAYRTDSSEPRFKDKTMVCCVSDDKDYFYISSFNHMPVRGHNYYSFWYKLIRR